ncbi:MAG: hypothetical protein DDT31_00044 [Syntrophomonadaceae bacterium]|nr:hypothetical protein [Bacillota bacterium]
MSILKELTNQASLKKSDGSDAGKNDVSSKTTANDITFSLMRNTINSDGKVSGSDVNNYLEKAHDINDEVETVVYGLETSDGEIVKVYVNAIQADAFEVEMKKFLGMEDDVEEAINDLATRFDIVDVVWPKGAGPETEENQDDSELDLSDGFGQHDDLSSEVAHKEDEKEEDEEEEDEMEVIAADDNADDNDDDNDDEIEPTKKDKSSDKKDGGKHNNLKNIGKNMKISEDKVHAGWYVYDKDNKTVAGPVDEVEANKICTQKGGDAKGFITGYISDYDARSANEKRTTNENQKETSMTIGDKFLKRVLAEGSSRKADTANKEDQDEMLDNKKIPMDAQHVSMANRLKWQLPKQVVQLFAMMGIPGMHLNAADAETSIAEATEMLRMQLSIRRAFLNFFNAYATAKGFSIKKNAPIKESRIKRGSALQKQLETVLVMLGLPEELVSTTGPAIVGNALFGASKVIEDNADLKQALHMLAIRMGLKSADFNAPITGPVIENTNLDIGDNLNLGAGQDIDHIEQLIKALGLEKVFNVQDIARTRKELRNFSLPQQALPIIKRLIVVLGGQLPAQARVRNTQQ